MSGTEKKMSLVDHLDELRSRSIWCIVAAVVGMIVAYTLYTPWILYLLRGPLDTLAGKSDNPFVFDNRLVSFLRSSLDESQRGSLDLHFVGLLEAFLVKLRTSLLGGLILASPFIFYHVAKFVTTGLMEKERKAVRLFVPASLGLFLCGLLFAYFIMLPVVVYFLVAGGGAGLIPNLTISQYVAPVAFCCLGFGVIFEMPLAILFLTRLGLVSPEFLRKKRRYAILLMFIVGAMLTPPDVVTQVMLALPMILLYEISIWVAKIARRRQNATEE